MAAAILRWVCRLARVVTAFMVIAGIVGLGAASSRLVAMAVDMVVTVSAGAADSSGSHALDDASKRAVELKAVDFDDDDDDDDPMCGVVHSAELCFRCAPPPAESDRIRHDEQSMDPSRFAAGRGLPRGPPLTTNA